MDPPNRYPKTKSFLHLPAELRSKIYSIALGGNVIHIGGTGYQPYVEGHLPDGRCCSCTAALSDHDCFALYTAQNKSLKGTLPSDRLAKRHRDCFRYPVSRCLNLSILLACRQIHNEAASLVFEENMFTLARPNSLWPFLARLNSEQLKSIRTLGVYSGNSRATWIGPFDDHNLSSYLTGLREVHVFMELQAFHISSMDIEKEFSEWGISHGRLSGLNIFKMPQLRAVGVKILTPDWDDVEADDLSDNTLEMLRKWETKVKEMLLPSGYDEISRQLSERCKLGDE